MSGVGELEVVVRRPLHITSPVGRLRRRWQAATARRARRRAAGHEGGGDAAVEAIGHAVDAVDDLAAIPVILAAIGGIIVLGVLFFAAPFLALIALFLLEMIVWVVLAVLGGAAAAVGLRPWNVAVVDGDSTVAAVSIRGRRRARAHADTVAGRLASGIDAQNAIRRT